jgi:hypothetical protein
MGGEERAASLLGGRELSGVAAEGDQLQLAGEFVVVRSHRLLPGTVSLRGSYGAGLFGLTGSVSGPQPDIAVLGPHDVTVMGALSVPEGLVGVADGGVTTRMTDQVYRHQVTPTVDAGKAAMERLFGQADDRKDGSAGG